MFTLAQLYCKNILPPVLCNYKIFLDCVSLQSLSPLPRVSWHRAAAALGSRGSARADLKWLPSGLLKCRRPAGPGQRPLRPAGPGRAGPRAAPEAGGGTSHSRLGFVPYSCLRNHRALFGGSKVEDTPRHRGSGSKFHLDHR